MDQLVDLSIEDFCARGFGLGSLNGSDVEVAHAIPGDRVRVQLVRKTHRVKKGRLLELLSPSPHRIPARCPHATMCGGCCWQAMAYEAQLEAEARADSALIRRAGFRRGDPPSDSVR